MTIALFDYNDDPRRLDKRGFLTQVGTHSGTAQDAVDLVQPSILVNGNVLTGNYCYVDTFNSYYYITEKTVVRNNLTNLILKRDGAMTALQQLLQSPCICARNGTLGNSDFADSKYPTYQNKYIETFAMSPLSNDDVIVFAFIE